MTKHVAIAATAALFMIQLGTAEASLASMPAERSTPPAASLTSAAFELPGDISSADQVGASDAVPDKLAFAVRVPGLKTVGRAVGSITGSRNNGSSERSSRPRPPQVRDHRSPRVTAPPRVRDHRAAPTSRERTRVDSRRGTQAQTRDHRAETRQRDRRSQPIRRDHRSR